jgi:hypothetical protein
MEQLLQVIVASLLAFHPSGGKNVRLNEGHCSLLVQVRDPPGNPLSAEVTVLERDGRKSVAKAANGEAQFCDLGINPVSISVGDPGCSQVVVRTPIEWEQTKTVKVVYDGGPCDDERPPLPTCKILFRVFGQDGAALTHAFITLSPPAALTTQHAADSFGRILVYVPAGQRWVGLAAAPGLREQPLDISCGPLDLRSERKVILER